jgi:hypothetical protein
MTGSYLRELVPGTDTPTPGQSISQATVTLQQLENRIISKVIMEIKE